MTDEEIKQIGKRAIERQPLRGMVLLITEENWDWPEQYVYGYVLGSEYEEYHRDTLLDGIRAAAEEKKENINESRMGHAENQYEALRELIAAYERKKYKQADRFPDRPGDSEPAYHCPFCTDRRRYREGETECSTCGAHLRPVIEVLAPGVTE